MRFIFAAIVWPRGSCSHSTTHEGLLQSSCCLGGSCSHPAAWGALAAILLPMRGFAAIVWPWGSCSHPAAWGALADILLLGGGSSCRHHVARGTCAAILLPGGGGGGTCSFAGAFPLQPYPPRVHLCQTVWLHSVGGGACSGISTGVLVGDAFRVFLAWYVFSGVQPSDSVCIPWFMAAPFQVDTQFCREMNDIFQVTYVRAIICITYICASIRDYTGSLSRYVRTCWAVGG